MHLPLPPLGSPRSRARIRRAIQLAGTNAAEVRGSTYAFYDEHVKGVPARRARGGPAAPRRGRQARAADLVLPATSRTRCSRSCGSTPRSATASRLTRPAAHRPHRRRLRLRHREARRRSGLCRAGGRAARRVRVSTPTSSSPPDLPGTEVVGQPVAVNPDGRLRREASRRGWPVVDWGTPESVTSRPGRAWHLAPENRGAVHAWEEIRSRCG